VAKKTGLTLILWGANSLASVWDQADGRPLGGGVGGAARGAETPRYGGHMHDFTALLGRDHVPGHRLGDDENPQGVDLECIALLRLVAVHHGDADRATDAGTMHEDIDFAESFDGGIDRRLDIGSAGDVAGQGQSLLALGRYRCHHFVEPPPVLVTA
jgi:hypothetical protein